jgi:hypothetical protein
MIVGGLIANPHQQDEARRHADGESRYIQEREEPMLG